MHILMVYNFLSQLPVGKILNYDTLCYFTFRFLKM